MSRYIVLDSPPSTPGPHLSSIIGVDLDEPYFTCIGYAKTRGRRCRNRISRILWQARRILDDADHEFWSGENVGPQLKQLAPLLLCGQWHKDQAGSMVSGWKDAIAEYVRKANKKASSSTKCIKQTASSSRQTETSVDKAHAALDILLKSSDLSTRSLGYHMLEHICERKTSGRIGQLEGRVNDLEASVNRLSRQSTADRQRPARDEESDHSSSETDDSSSETDDSDSETDDSDSESDDSDSESDDSDSETDISDSETETSPGPRKRNNTQASQTRNIQSKSPVEKGSSSTDATRGANRANICPSPQRGSDTSSNSAHRPGTRKTVEGECGICYDLLVIPYEDGDLASDDSDDDASDSDDLLWCQSTCGTNYHRDCLETWLTSCRRQEIQPTCPNW